MPKLVDDDGTVLLDDVSYAESGWGRVITLQYKNLRLREALEKIANPPTVFGTDDPYSVWSWFVDVAEEALEEVSDG